MLSKFLFVFVVFAVLGISANVHGAAAIFDNQGGTGDGLWSNSANWFNGIYPWVAGNQTYVRNPAVGPAIIGGSYAASTTSWLVVNQGNFAGTSELRIQDNGSLNVPNNIFMGNGAALGTAAQGKISLYGNGLLTSSGYINAGQFSNGGLNSIYATDDSIIRLTGSGTAATFYLANNANTNVLMDLSGNAKTFSNFCNVGVQGAATLNVSGNAWMTINDSLFIANFNNLTVATVNMMGGRIDAKSMGVGNGNGTLNMSGGIINLSDTLSISDTGVSGTFNITGGTLYAKNLSLGLATNMMTVANNGKVVLQGDQIALVEQYINDGLLTVGAYYKDATSTYLVPEPATMLLLGLGSLIFVRRTGR